MSDGRIGERFVLGFRGLSLPAWIRTFEEEFGLGGLILFDVDVESGVQERNVQNPDQLRELCAEIHALPSRPLVFIDQEGGAVRRLKPERGFAPLPSAARFGRLTEVEQRDLAGESYREMANLGIDFNLAPVVDLETNRSSPGLAALGRCFSGDPGQVRRNVRLLGEVASGVGLRLCMKHYPGIGAATTDTHEEVTDLTGRVSEAQLSLFTDLWPSIPGGGILLSHGLVRNWDDRSPVSISRAAVDHIREQLPKALLITDDLQMGGLQAHCGTVEACLRAIEAGVDLLCLSNNERVREGEAAEAVRAITASRRGGTRG